MGAYLEIAGEGGKEYAFIEDGEPLENAKHRFVSYNDLA
jgi:hypothetical protein